MFTVLMSVYAGEKAPFLEAALASLCGQTMPPARVVLVQDGPLPDALHEVIGRYRSLLPLKEVELPVNLGLASALNAGLREVDTAWVARFDSDDICLPHRLERQALVALSGDFDIFGAQIEEFDQHPGDLGLMRLVPCEPERILAFARRRNPLNHMTVCFKADVVRSLGGYPDRIPLMEDYALWLLALARGARLGNGRDVLVAARTGAGMFARRGGLAYLRSELLMQRLCVKLGLKGPAGALLDGTIRMAGFVLPAHWRGFLYRALLRGTARIRPPRSSP